MSNEDVDVTRSKYFACVRIYFLNNWIMIKVESRIERSFRPKVDSPGGASAWFRSILSCSQPKIKFKEKRAKTEIAKPCVSECFNNFFFCKLPLISSAPFRDRWVLIVSQSSPRSPLLSRIRDVQQHCIVASLVESYSQHGRTDFWLL